MMESHSGEFMYCCVTPPLLLIAEYGNYLHRSLLTTKKWMNLASGTQNGNIQPAGQ